MKIVNQQWIKGSNLKQIYRYIFQEPGISRAALAKKARLSKTTVSTLVDELIERRFVHDAGAVESAAVGRRPNGLQASAGSYYAAVIGWERRGIRMSLVDVTGTAALEDYAGLDGAGDYLSATRAMLSRIPAWEERADILGLCVVVPAMIDAQMEELYSIPLDLTGEKGARVVRELRGLSRYPAALLNDTACYAYAEKIFAGVSESDFAFFNFSHGIGGTLFLQDKMLGGASGFATQIGHFSVDPGGKPCPCGGRGCLEVVMGEDSLKERVRAAGPSPALDSMERVSYSDLGKAAVSGDPAARRAVQDMARDIALVLGNLVCLVHPRLVVLGGRCQSLGGLFLDEIRACAGSAGFRKMMQPLDIRYTRLDSRAYLKGAMRYFFDTHYQFTQDLTGAFFIG